MKKAKENGKLSTSLCKAALSLSMASLKVQNDDCTFILYEPKQPESLQHVDLKQLKKNL